MHPVRITNQPPNVPTIKGKSQRGKGVEYDFAFKSIDPEGDQVWYEVEWGEKPKISWAGPYSSGFEVKLARYGLIREFIPSRLEQKTSTTK